jgi:predicted membrane protein
VYTELRSQRAVLRPYFTIEATPVPIWVAGILLVTAVLALVGNTNDIFLAKTVFIILLLPYFLCGIAMLHNITHTWPARRLWLVLIYVFMIVMAWPAILIISAGVYTQCNALMNKNKDNIR